jgi:hypothetical protein
MDESPTEKQPPTVLASDTENATQVRPSEAPAHKQQKFQRFRAYNTGLWNGPRRENKEAMHRQDDLHLWDAIAAQLDLTDSQKKRGRRLFDSLDVDALTARREWASRHVAFGLAVVVANDDVRDGTRYWPQSKHADECFASFADGFDFDWKMELSLIKQVQHRADL